MATYRLSAKVISRSEGRSATGAAAYRSGERLVDERTGEVFDYRRRGDVLDREILAPASAPAWGQERERLWNAVESVEKRKDAQVAREIQVSLPHELSLDAQRALLHDWVREQLVARGMVADVAIHAAHKGGDARNVHAHVLLTTRTITPEGFAGKDRSWNDRAVLEEWRSSWEQHLNRALERARVAERVDHRSYAQRGIDREPEPKQGPVATQMERGGRRSHAGEDRRAARERNAERERLRDEERRVEQAQRDEGRRRAAAREPERDADARPGIGAAEVPGWQRWREQVLTEAYAREMEGSRLARFWRIERTQEGLAFENARGRFEDRGSEIVARAGNEVEIRGMLDLAEVKEWRELTVSGSEAFKRQAMAAALDRGFAVRAEGRDAELLREVEEARTSNSRSITREVERTRENDGWER